MIVQIALRHQRALDAYRSAVAIILLRKHPKILDFQSQNAIRNVSRDTTDAHGVRDNSPGGRTDRVPSAFANVRAIPGGDSTSRKRMPS
jgi:hypothetical protein